MNNHLLKAIFVGVCLTLCAGSLQATNVELLGAGATFPFPLYSKMFSEYNKKFGVKVNYQSIGSGGGIRQLKNMTVDFGASDAFLSKEESKDIPGMVLHVPTCLGAVALGYNVPGNPELKLSPEVVADIFLGKIVHWNDAKLKALNPGVLLPNLPITVVHRADGSGTTAVFTDYLSKISQTWNKQVGPGKAVNWPVGLGGKGNEGVAGLLEKTPGSVGYIEFVYAVQNKITVAQIKNKSGVFVKPSLESVANAAAISLPEDTKISLTNTEAKNGYPISGFSWILLYADQKYGDHSEVKAKELVKLVTWMIHDGQAYNKELQYASLPKDAVKKAEKILASIKYGNKKV